MSLVCLHPHSTFLPVLFLRDPPDTYGVYPGGNLVVSGSGLSWLTPRVRPDRFTDDCVYLLRGGFGSRLLVVCTMDVLLCEPECSLFLVFTNKTNEPCPWTRCLPVSFLPRRLTLRDSSPESEVWTQTVTGPPSPWVFSVFPEGPQKW